MLHRIADLPGAGLSLASYSDAFDEAYKGIVFWKLERRQSFREPGVPSWEAFAAGDCSAASSADRLMRWTRCTPQR